MKKAYFRGLSALFLIAIMVSQFVFSVNNVAAFAGGDGSEGSPFQITTCEEFKDISDDLLASYSLSNDLDCSSDGNTIIVGASDQVFQGTFEGNNHTVTLDLDSSTNSTGLFAVIQNASVSNLTVAGSVTSTALSTGALAGGIAETTLTNITVTASVEQTGTGSYTGGIAGSGGGSSFVGTNLVNTAEVTGANVTGGLFGSLNCEAQLSNSYSTGNVTGGDNVGGIAGDDGCEGPGSSYDNVYATGNVTGGDRVGGIVGRASNSTMLRVYATGIVVGNNYVGGIAGRIAYETEIDQSFSTAGIQVNGNYAGGIAGSLDSGSITNSYARRALHGNYNGGIVGDASEGTIINSYSTALLDLGSDGWGGISPSVAEGASATNTFWDVEAANSGDSALGTGKSTAQMKSIATFTTELGEGAWNFDSIWSIGESNDGYPCLQWSDASCTVEEVSSDDDDGIPSAVENAGPNNGDANNDGTADAAQANVASYINPISGAYSVLAVDAACSITSVQSVAESALGSTQDANYSYPAGLMNFTIDCGEAGFVATITQYHYGVEGNFIVRKNTPSFGYFTLDQASAIKQTIGGQVAAVATYQVIDGGTLDIDGQANGVIIDPAGLAESTTLADTGANTATIQLLAAALVLVGGTMFVAQHRANKRG